MMPLAKAQLLKTLAHDIGFDLVGVTHAAPLERGAYYRDWLAAGYGASMAYLQRNVRLRADPSLLLPGARSVIVTAVAYKRPDGYLTPSVRAHDLPRPPQNSTAPTGRIAQYARGRDYHLVLRHMLLTLVQQLRARLAEPFEARVFVDTGPLLERELAVAAGLGWFGKNTCLLNPRLGSYLLLGEIVSTLELPPDTPLSQRCGHCTRCIDTCPTGALVEPHRLDASRCLAYLTIEHRGAIPSRFSTAFGDYVFGCDLCQQVCPYNAKAPLGTHPEINAEHVPATLPLLPLLNLRSGDYRRLTRDGALRRAHRNMWRRNAAIVLGNHSPRSDAERAALSLAASDEDAGLRAAATAALAHNTPPKTPATPPLDLQTP